MTELAPGDFLSTYSGMDAEVSEEAVASTRESLSLDKPLKRYMMWIGRVVRGDLGHSLISHTNITKLIMRRLGQTMLLMTTAILLSVVIGNGLGILAGLKANTLLDYVLTILAFVTVSIPGFFIGMLFIYIFAVKLKILPTGGISSYSSNTILDLLRHLILPSIVLTLKDIAIYARFARASVLEVLSATYVTTAYAKGLKHKTVVTKHVVRNALMPIVTVIGTRLPRIFGGALIIETVFSWPGVGLLAFNAISSRDYPVIMGVTLVIGTVVLLINFIVDMCYMLVDPRIRYA